MLAASWYMDSLDPCRNRNLEVATGSIVPRCSVRLYRIYLGPKVPMYGLL